MNKLLPLIHTLPCKGNCLGLACECRYECCIKGDFNHDCPFARVNQSLSLFLLIFTIAMIFALFYKP